jgi:hypothetical protein
VSQICKHIGNGLPIVSKHNWMNGNNVTKPTNGSKKCSLKLEESNSLRSCRSQAYSALQILQSKGETTSTRPSGPQTVSRLSSRYVEYLHIRCLSHMFLMSGLSTTGNFEIEVHEASAPIDLAAFEFQQ